jgi:superfamily II DNA or RNA helicase
MDPYERFQPQAVRAIVSDFQKKPTGRFLLIIPTGGGKTFTAIRAIGGLFAAGVLRRGENRAVWVAHREELLIQARGAVARYNKRFPENHLAEGTDIVFSMMATAKANIRDPKTKYVVLDEAHHGAAPTYYDAVFEQDHAGILGLTATPSRHDGKALDFERESYSIGFPDLIKLNVLINPTVIPVKGIKIDSVTSWSSEEDLELLNNAERDASLIRCLLNEHEKFQKVIVYVGTKNHARSLYERMLKSKIPEIYGSVAWVFGGVRDNSRGQEREAFFEQEKALKRAVLINVSMLTEGYDDQTVNTVVMAAPCKSKLYCFQVVGRAVRRDPDNLEKAAYVVEVVDDLPNIRYQMDNRWLFSDISDDLEPSVQDESYCSAGEFTRKLFEVCDRHNVRGGAPDFGEWSIDSRYSLLLFKRYAGDGLYEHVALPISPESRDGIRNAFNFLSERMEKYFAESVAAKQVMWFTSIASCPTMSEPEMFQEVYQAMRNQWAVISEGDCAPFIKSGYPWISFIAFRYWQSESTLPDDLLEFIRPCSNFDDLLKALQERAYPASSSIVRIPLPLKGFIGRIVAEDDVQCIGRTLQSLRNKETLPGNEQSDGVLHILHEAIMPIEARLHSGLLHIVKYNYEWKKQIP